MRAFVGRRLVYQSPFLATLATSDPRMARSMVATTLPGWPEFRPLPTENRARSGSGGERRTPAKHRIGPGSEGAVDPGCLARGALDLLPSSHASPAAMLTTLSPHSGAVQSASHAIVAIPSSHASTPICTLPSPHFALMHIAVHASVSTMLPSSHSSPICTIPSPHEADAHMFVQPSPSTMLPSSHASTDSHTTPSPHVAFAQLFRHASVSTALPSSHSSVPSNTAPSPHFAATQVLRQSSVSTSLPLLATWAANGLNSRVYGTSVCRPRKSNQDRTKFIPRREIALPRNAPWRILRWTVLRGRVAAAAPAGSVRSRGVPVVWTCDPSREFCPSGHMVVAAAGAGIAHALPR